MTLVVFIKKIDVDVICSLFKVTRWLPFCKGRCLFSFKNVIFSAVNKIKGAKITIFV